MDKRLLFRLCEACKLKWLEERDWNVEWLFGKVWHISRQNYWLGIRCLWAECIAFFHDLIQQYYYLRKRLQSVSARMFFFPTTSSPEANSDSKTEVISQAEETYGSVKQSNSRFRAWCWFYFLLNCCFLVSIRGQSNGQDWFPFAQYLCREGEKKCICFRKCDTFQNHKFILVPLMFWCFMCK